MGALFDDLFVSASTEFRNHLCTLTFFRQKLEATYSKCLIFKYQDNSSLRKFYFPYCFRSGKLFILQKTQLVRMFNICLTYITMKHNNYYYNTTHHDLFTCWSINKPVKTLGISCCIHSGRVEYHWCVTYTLPSESYQVSNFNI